MSANRPRWLLAAAALALAAATACTGQPAEELSGDQPTATDEVPSPLADCESLAAPPVEAAASGTGAGDPLPAVTLPCFTGGAPVELADLPGPAVVNLWASWCPPCRDELPVLQEYADQMDGRVHVVGVVTEDTRAGAAAFATEAGVRFPAVYDRDGQVRAATGAVGLPVTLFVDGNGAVSYLHQGELDADALHRYADEHLGVGRP